MGTFGDWLTLSSILFGVYVFRRQMNAQVLVEYTRRFDEICRAKAGGKSFLDSLADGPLEGGSPERDELIRRYVSLCSEEFYLWWRVYLSTDIWSIWEREIVRVLRTPAVREWWARKREDFGSFRQFRRYVDGVQKQTEVVFSPLEPSGPITALRRLLAALGGSA